MLPALMRDRSGAAAAEMVLALPLVAAMLFGFVEIGNWMLTEHVVVKSVRDGARFAGRQRFADMPCGSTSTRDAAIKNVVKYGNPGGSGNARLPGTWSITVSTACPAKGSYAGIYEGMASTPRVTVSATVTYKPLFGAMGFGASNASLRASSQSAVMGI